ncbi:hypothetical protein IQ07DRAFT_591161 [Pyrenochaeta sp. DS3sAY3a]|nr:hypothetical protein IQ07DRAFT_591161 [Pyrenochaeta sp. DS3sAY3a]
MVQNVLSLHQTAEGDLTVTFPFSVKDYQRYVFGDDRLAHTFGTDLAKAFIDRGPGFGAAQPTTTSSNQSPSDDFAVAVLSDHVPTATHSLRNHFVAYLNRHLVSINARPALRIDLHRVGERSQGRHGPQANDTYHIDRERLGSKSLIVLADLRTSQNDEARITESLRRLRLDNPIVFLYLASLEHLANASALSPILSFVVSPSINDVESIAQVERFAMNECFVQYVLGREYAQFCSFIRRQDDSFARLLLDYAICGLFYENDLYEQNVKFLLWEVAARESM